jgi:hypothetical protein
MVLKKSLHGYFSLFDPDVISNNVYNPNVNTNVNTNVNAGAKKGQGVIP